MVAKSSVDTTDIFMLEPHKRILTLSLLAVQLHSQLHSHHPRGRYLDCIVTLWQLEKSK